MLNVEKSPDDLELGTRMPYVTAIGWTVLICDLVVTLALWAFVSNNAQKEALGRFQFRSHEVQVAIEERLKAYEQVLRGAVGLIESAHHNVDRDMFKTYVEHLNIGERYRGIQGIGLSIPVSLQDKEKHIQEVRESGFPNYTIKPEGEREHYTAIIYLEPFSGRNIRAHGYDMFSESVRRKAMERARDTGKPSISGKIFLVQETEEDIQTGFLMYLPIYTRNMPIKTVEERRAALFGYVYSPFRSRDFLEGVLGRKKIPDMAFSLYDGTDISEKSLLYNSNPNHTTQSLFNNIPKIEFNNHTWCLSLSSLEPFENSIKKGNSLIVLMTGLIICVTYFTILFLIHTAQNKAVKGAKQLYESEKRLRDILYHSPALIFIKDLDGRYTFSNRKNEIITGISSETILGKTAQEVFPKHIADQFDANDNKVMETLVHQVVEEEVPQKEGPPLTFLSTQFPLIGSNNIPYAICGISTDITERKAAVRDLQMYRHRLEALVQQRTWQLEKLNIDLLAEIGERTVSENRLNLVLDATEAGVWDWNIKTGHVFFSPNWFKSLGYEPDEMKPNIRTWEKLVHPEDMPKVKKELEAHLSKEVPFYECVNRLMTKSGEYRWNLDRGKVVAWDKEGNPVRMVGTNVDITERKKNEIEMKVREEHLSQAQEIAHLGSWTWEVQNKKLSWSDEIYRIFGIEQSELKPSYEKFISLVHKEDREFVHQENRESVLGKNCYHIQFRIIMPNGDSKYVQQKAKTDYDHQGYPQRVVGILHDIDKMKVADESLLKNREKFRLLYNQISELLEGTSSATSGENFFQSLVYHLASTLGFGFCFIGKLDQKNFEICQTLAFFKDGENVPNIKYKIHNTPCEKIYQGAAVYYTNNLPEEFPEDEDIKSFGLESYFGVPIFGNTRTPVAHLVVMDRKPTNYSPEIMSILSLFAARAESEIKRIEFKKELKISQERLRELNKKMQSVREEEKLRLAREIHDELGQVITYCKLDLLWIIKEIKSPGEKIENKLEAMVSHLEDSLRSVRRISSELRPEILDVMGISEGIKWQAEKFKDQTQIEYELVIVPEKFECDRDMSIDLFRVFQEILTNVSRHSQATFVQINFLLEEEFIKLTVKDNGKGFDTKLQTLTRSLGILGMKERARNWNGEVDIASKIGIGTTISVILPKKDNHECSV